MSREEFGGAEGENPRREPLRARLARLGRTKPRGCAGVGHNRRDRAILKKPDHQWLWRRLERALLATRRARLRMVTARCPPFARSGGCLKFVARSPGSPGYFGGPGCLKSALHLASDDALNEKAPARPA